MKIFELNKAWSEDVTKSNPEFFAELAKGQQPQYLWIGCSDSRVPAEQICGLKPGDIFVHRNVANLVVENDLNCLAVLDFALNVLKVPNIIICGHYDCGGINAVLNGGAPKETDRWLSSIKGKIKSKDLKSAVEENIHLQVDALKKLEIVKAANEENQALKIYGLVFDISTAFPKKGEHL
jgi:carbonic anhydrase